ncbi:MAG: 30S ribosomal protein S8 [Candidatus Omnitrophica bacterium]|nr:30S ribosomal protein S8 [Candidatus Omnitrophota bacterium]
MPITDFAADFLTVIRNASKARKDKITLPASNMTIRIAEILKDEGFIRSVKVFSEGNKRFARIHLKYVKGGRPAIQGIRRISKPGLRSYVGYESIPKVRGGLGVAIVSTSKGLMVGRSARKEKAGGELICCVW